MSQSSDLDSCILASVAKIRQWAQGFYEEVFRIAPDSAPLADVILPEGLKVIRPTGNSKRNIAIELKGDKARAFLRMEGMELTKRSGPPWNRQLDLDFVPSEIALSLPVGPKDEAVGIKERVVTTRFGDWYNPLAHLSIKHYYESPQLIVQEVLERQDGSTQMAFYRSHVTSISVRSEREDGAFIGGNIRLQGDIHYFFKEWPFLARRNVTISPRWDLQSGEKPEFGLNTRSTSDRPLASAAQLFQVGLDSSAEAWTKIQELCDACPEVIDLEDWLNSVVSFIATTGLSVTTVPSEKSRASLVTETAQGLLA